MSRLTFKKRKPWKYYFGAAVVAVVAGRAL